MPLDFTFVGRAFDENPDPERLRKILDELLGLFAEEVKPYLDQDGLVKSSGDVNFEETPLYKTIMKIESWKSELEASGWPEAHKDMLEDFNFQLYKSVGLHIAANWK